MDALQARFQSEGRRAVFVPEAATDLILSGIAPWTCSSMLEFQTQVIALQLKREAKAFGQAEELGAGTMVVCDRGICDSHAYLSSGDYRCALQANGLDEKAALARYDAVFHLESVAKANPAAYTRANNGARFENAAEAIDADNRGIAAWAAHPHVHLIPNEEMFEQKAQNLLRAIDEEAWFAG